METTDRAELYQRAEAESYVADLQAKAKRSNEYLEWQSARVEAERIEGIGEKIRHTVAALYFAEQSVERLRSEYQGYLKQDPCIRTNTRVKESLDEAERQVEEFRSYLAEQSTPGQPYTAAEITAEQERFAEVQDRPAKLAAQVAAAEVINRKAAQPQAETGKPQVMFPCPKCGSNLPSAGVALHRNAGTGWCVVSPRKAYASGRDQFWLVSEGGCSVQELRDSNIPIPEGLIT
jgi:hypothetical protein